MEPDQHPNQPDLPPDPGRQRIRTRSTALHSLNTNVNIQFIPIPVSSPPLNLENSSQSPNSRAHSSNRLPLQSSIASSQNISVPVVPVAVASSSLSDHQPSTSSHHQQQQQLGDSSSSPSGARDVNPLSQPASSQPVNQNIEVGEQENNVENLDPDVVFISVQQNSPDQIMHIGSIEENAVEGNLVPLILSDVARASPSGSGKKRKRSKSKTPKKPPKHSDYADDDDDGTTCPICLDHWEMSGPHRLTSLKCGHLFGDQCIKRWLAECTSGNKCCPSCKTRVVYRDLRYIYAKRIRAIDNTEEIRLKEALDVEKNKNTKLQTDYELMAFELKSVKSQVTKLQNDLERVRRIANYDGSTSTEGNSVEKYKKYAFNHRMFMSKNIEISKEPGCRVMIYSKLNRNLMVSQKSTQSLFPGYGVKFIDANNSFRPNTFLHTSLKGLRDLALNSSEDLLVCASMEKSAKIFDVKSLTVVKVFNQPDKTIWSCAIDKDARFNFVYLGSQHGSTYIYDMRNPSAFIEEASVLGDLSPVINIAPVKLSDNFPLGGFLVCKLQSLWFYEFLPSQALEASRLAVDGPFMSMNYDCVNETILISTRPSAKFPMSKYILGKIIKLNDIITLDIEMSLFGSKTTQVMSRCTQIPVKDNSLVAAYIQDAKHITLWNVGESTKIQSLPCSETIFDTCPVFGSSNDKTFVAALTEMKCRIYEIISTAKH